MIPRFLVVMLILLATAGIITAIAQAECTYVVGDVNGNGSFTGLDVTYAVRYFKGGPQPPYSCECPSGSGHVWFVTGDANASCSFNGIDVIFMVRNFRMDPTGAIPCPLCPGSHGIFKNRDDIPIQAK
jgi:hypothetical protein